jgi:hypothetical protein
LQLQKRELQDCVDQNSRLPTNSYLGIGKAGSSGAAVSSAVAKALSSSNVNEAMQVLRDEDDGAMDSKKKLGALHSSAENITKRPEYIGMCQLQLSHS